MRKITVLLMSGLFLSGCIYSIRLNSFLDRTSNLAQTIPENSIFVVENKEAKNPIFETEIKSKIEKLLKQKGYQIESSDKADLYLAFNYSVEGYEHSGTIPFPQQAQINTYDSKGWYSGTSTVNYLTLMPYKKTEYARFLSLGLFDANQLRDKKEIELIWLCNATSSGSSNDLRQVIDYLLVAVFKHFGKDTGRTIQLELYEGDKRVKSLSQPSERDEVH